MDCQWTAASCGFICLRCDPAGELPVPTAAHRRDCDAVLALKARRGPRRLIANPPVPSASAPSFPHTTPMIDAFPQALADLEEKRECWDQPGGLPVRPLAEARAYLARCVECRAARIEEDGRIGCHQNCGCAGGADHLLNLLALQRGDCPVKRWGLYPEITTRHLVYHVCPLTRNEVWRSNIERLRRHWEAFSGRKLIAIATGENLHSPAVVHAAFPPECEFMEIENDVELREVASLPALLEAIADTDPHSATFYAHTKGNSTADDPRAAARWRNMMYRILLGGWRQAMDALRLYAACGADKIVWPVTERPPYPTRLPLGRWMFAGTFWWIRHDQVFTRDWRRIPRDRYAAEAWLSGVIHSPWSACSLYQPWPEEVYPTPCPYQVHLYPDDDEG